LGFRRPAQAKPFADRAEVPEPARDTLPMGEGVKTLGAGNIEIAVDGAIHPAANIGIAVIGHGNSPCCSPHSTDAPSSRLILALWFSCRPLVFSQAGPTRRRRATRGRAGVIQMRQALSVRLTRDPRGTDGTPRIGPPARRRAAGPRSPAPSPTGTAMARACV